MRSVRTDGRSFTATFRAAYDGKPHRVTGLPDVDAVALRAPSESIVDATFTLRGRPVFGYRAVRSSDDRALTIISVAPETRRVLTSVVVYDRQ
ncbi:MAG TPA: hypothetical protein VMF13_09340 [Luteitalea sp.]|nr:hypothetical protein [Luteitalea sp.]